MVPPRSSEMGRNHGVTSAEKRACEPCNVDGELTSNGVDGVGTSESQLRCHRAHVPQKTCEIAVLQVQIV